MPRPNQNEQPPPLETLAGTIERVTFHNADSGFAVLRVKARGKRDLITVIGHAPFISAGEFVTASGVWVTDRSHGLQFKAQMLKATPPTGADGIERYLASGQMRGIGPAMAKRIVAAFGEATFEIIEADPDRLTEVSGIGPMRAARIVSGWSEQKAVREIMIFLHAHGVGTARAVRIFKTYSHESIKVMTDDPYRLARDIRGIGFRTADDIAAKLGMEKTAPQRLRAGISFALQTATDQGHCGLPLYKLLVLAVELLGVDVALTGTAVDDVLTQGEVVQDLIGDQALVVRASRRRFGARRAAGTGGRRKNAVRLVITRSAVSIDVATLVLLLACGMRPLLDLVGVSRLWEARKRAFAAQAIAGQVSQASALVAACALKAKILATA